ncbi:hypothetical protein BGX29_008443 [Mortierella sp. GBA35]|nr:hypothetical protein BGX29_008443 [Mortierella sp. GBA35]
MRLSTIIASSALALLATVSAQSTGAPNQQALAACYKCLGESGIAQTPACKGLENNKANPSLDKLTDQQKTCYCGLGANSAWITSCVKPDLCTNEMVLGLTEVYKSVPSSVCDSVSLKSEGVSSSKVATSVTVAAAMVALGALL